MSAEIEQKKQAVAGLIDGKVEDQSHRVAVCIKGTVNDFPVTFEAMMTGWPFGVMYIVETPRAPEPDNAPVQAEQIGIYPRMGRGFASIFTHVLLFEGKGLPVGDKRLEGQFNFSYSNREVAEFFCSIPEAAELVRRLQEKGGFSELIIRTTAGIYLAQPKSFNALELNKCEETFVLLSQLAEILAENF